MSTPPIEPQLTPLEITVVASAGLIYANKRCLNGWKEQGFCKPMHPQSNNNKSKNPILVAIFATHNPHQEPMSQNNSGNDWAAMHYTCNYLGNPQ
jgi:hypothetical protein